MGKVFHFATLALFAGISLVGCSSTPEGPGELEKTYNTSTGDNREQVGMRDDKVVVQKRIYLEEQLFSLKSEVDDLQSTIFGKSRQDPGGLYLGLKDCRNRLSDPRLGGNGKPQPMEKWVNITAQDEQFFFKADKNNHLVGVSEEALDNRIQRFQKHQRMLTEQYDSFKDKLDTCEETYRTALVQHGLNPDDTKAKGEWVEGPHGYKVWQMKKAATKDPEELMRRKTEGIKPVPAETE
jgi:TolA-binding protein